MIATTTNEQLPVMKGNYTNGAQYTNYSNSAINAPSVGKSIHKPKINSFTNLEGSFHTPASNFNSPLMNTWTNNKFVNNNKEVNEEEKKPKRLSHRPRSGNPSPTKMLPDNGELKSNIPSSYNSRQNPIYANNANYLTSFKDHNPPQPHQRNIKKSMIGHKQNNMSNDMYRIYGVNKAELGVHTAGNTPKTSSGKRVQSGNNHFALRMNNQMVPNRMMQHTSHGNRSVSPNRPIDQNISNDKDLFIGQNRPNMVDILKFQARKNLKNLEIDMTALIGRNKKMIDKNKIGDNNNP